MPDNSDDSKKKSHFPSETKIHPGHWSVGGKPVTISKGEAERATEAYKRGVSRSVRGEEYLQSLSKKSRSVGGVPGIKEQAISESSRKTLAVENVRKASATAGDIIRSGRAAYGSRAPISDLIYPSRVALQEKKSLKESMVKTDPYKGEELKTTSSIPAQDDKLPSGRMDEWKPTGIGEWITHQWGKTESETKKEGSGTKSNLKMQLFGAGLLALSYGKGFVEGVTAPFKPSTYKGLWDAIRNPAETRERLYSVGEEIRQNPLKIGEFAGQVHGTSLVVSKVAKHQPFKYNKLEVPTKDGGSITYRGVGVEFGSRGRPIIGIKNGKIVWGTPNLDLSQVGGAFIAEGSSSTHILRSNLAKYAPDEALKLDYGTKVLRGTSHTSSKFVRDTFIEDTKTLTPKQVREVLKAAKRSDSTVYGSFGARQQMPDELARQPGDMDVQTVMSADDTVSFADDLVRDLNKVKGGSKVRISPQRSSLIEVKGTDGQWHHAVDIHSVDDAVVDAASPAMGGEKAYGFSMTQKPIRIDGVKVQRLSEQGVRKGASIFTVRPSKDGLVLMPEAHRLKDISDFYTTQEALIRSKWFGGETVRRYLERLKGLYPEMEAGGSSSFVIQEPPSFTGSSAPSPTGLLGSSAGSSSYSSYSISLPSSSGVIISGASSALTSDSKTSLSSKGLISPSSVSSMSNGLYASRSAFKSLSKTSASSSLSLDTSGSRSSYSPSPSPSSGSASSGMRSPSKSSSPSKSPGSASKSRSPYSPSYYSSGSPSPRIVSPGFRRRSRRFTKRFLRRLRILQPKKYVPTGLAATFSIFGKPSRRGEQTGLGPRPVPTKKKRKKKKRRTLWFKI